jgi:soluble lytic murein transglycosylase-like protein
MRHSTWTSTLACTAALALLRFTGDLQAPGGADQRGRTAALVQPGAPAAWAPSGFRAFPGDRPLVYPEAARSWGLSDSGERHTARITAFASHYRIRQQLSRQIYEAARAEQVSPALAFGLVRVESGFDPQAVGPSGSIGLTQIRPGTAREIAPEVTSDDLYSPRLNLRLGFRYLRSLLDRFDQDAALALAAYNGGPGLVEQLLARGQRPRGEYARKILRNVERAPPATL